MPASSGRVHGTLKKLLPTQRRVCLRPHAVASYAGSIIIPESAKSVVPNTGVIEALGFDFEEDHPLRVGDTVAFSKYGGVELGFDDGQRRLIVHEDDILCVLSADNAIEDGKS